MNERRTNPAAPAWRMAMSAATAAGWAIFGMLLIMIVALVGQEVPRP